MIEPTDATLRRQLAEEAKELMDNRAFKAAILTLRQQWFGELMASRDRPMQDQLVAQLKALEGIPARLESLIMNEKMAHQRRA